MANAEEAMPVVDELVVLKKFEGDYTQEQLEQDDAPEPIETITIHNGEVIEHWRKEDDS